MKQPLIILVTVASTILAALLFIGFLQPGRPLEPWYQGRPLRSWLDDIVFRSQAERARGEQAVLVIGTNAIPFLLWELQVKKYSPLKKRLMDWVVRERFLEPIRRAFGLWDAPDEKLHHERAVSGFRVLGSNGRSALPALAKLAGRSDTAWQTTRVLAAYDNLGDLYLGSEVAAPLLLALTNQNPEVRCLAANGLNLAQTNASVVVPALLRALRDPDPGVRAMAAMSLGGPAYKTEVVIIIPALIACLDDADARVRARAAKRLGLFGGDACAALPGLFRVLTDADGEAKTSAAQAIEQIDPGAVSGANPRVLRGD